MRHTWAGVEESASEQMQQSAFQSTRSDFKRPLLTQGVALQPKDFAQRLPKLHACNELFHSDKHTTLLFV